MNANSNLFIDVRKEISRLWNVKGHDAQAVKKNDNTSTKAASSRNIPLSNQATTEITNSKSIQVTCYERESLIGENISIEGIIRAEENLTIDGDVKGTVSAGAYRLIVGEKGRVAADIHAAEIVINGHVYGTVTAFNSVKIGKTAQITGQIKAGSVSVEDGAFLKASIELDKEIKENHGVVQHSVEAILFTKDIQHQAVVENEAARIAMQ
jgi:cytoskeletal protein CcmA (bactofilin family)